MSCEICGRSVCCAIFHSLEEQESFDNVADGIKERLANKIARQVGNLDCIWGIEELDGVDPDDVYVKLSDVQKVIWESY